jgi:hypothetical protein
MRTYDRLWQQDELSDVDVVLTEVQHNSSTQDSSLPVVKREEEEEGEIEEELCKLIAFPGHGVLLSESPVFRKQVC